MNPQDPDQDYNPKERVGNELSVTQPGEVVVCEIKRHPIGIISIYVVIGFLLVVIAVVAFGVLPSVVGEANRNTAIQVGSAVFLILAVVLGVYSLIATKIYWGNRWIVTSDSITQIRQTGLFTRQSSQLALESIEDVGAEQNGLLTHVFHYGVLKVETAGRREKFVFPFCPNPNFYARKILEAREAYDRGGHAEYGKTQAAEQSSGQPQPDNYTPPNQSGQNFTSNL